MKSVEIINSILAGKTYENMVAIYSAFGPDVVEFAINECKENGIKVPHVIMDVRGPIIAKQNESIIETIVNCPDYETQQQLVMAYGLDRVNKAVKGLGKTVPHIVYDVIGPLNFEQSKTVIGQLSGGETSYEEKQLIAKAYGMEKVEGSIKSVGSKNVPHIVADVIGPLRAEGKEKA